MTILLMSVGRDHIRFLQLYRHPRCVSYEVMLRRLQKMSLINLRRG